MTAVRNFTGDTSIAVPTLALLTDSGVSTDKITNVGTVSVSNLETGGTYSYSTDAGVTFTTFTGSTFTLSGDGSKSVLVKQVDAAGNTGTSTALAFTLDKTIATPTVALTTDSGTAGDKITNSAALTLSTAAADVTRTYTVDGGTAAST